MNEEIPLEDMPYRELALGFHPPELDFGSLDPEQLLRSGRDWKIVAAVNMLCRSGDFSKIDYLVPILKRDDDSQMWDAVVKIAGFGGSWTQVSRSTQQLVGILDRPGVRYYIALLLGAACDTRAIDPLLDLYRTSEDSEEARNQIMRELSVLLEPADETIFLARQDNLPYREVVEIAKSRLETISSTLDGYTLFEAQNLDIPRLARRLWDRLDLEQLQSERFYRGRLVFEAATGVNCTAFYDQLGRLNRLAAMGILEEFLESDQVNRLVPGQRYFFGHPIPN